MITYYRSKTSISNIQLKLNHCSFFIHRRRTSSYENEENDSGKYNNSPSSIHSLSFVEFYDLIQRPILYSIKIHRLIHLHNIQRRFMRWMQCHIAHSVFENTKWFERRRKAIPNTSDAYPIPNITHNQNYHSLFTILEGYRLSIQPVFECWLHITHAHKVSRHSWAPCWTYKEEKKMAAHFYE